MHAITITYNTQLNMVQACLNLIFTCGSRYIRLQSDRLHMNQTAKILAISLLNATITVLQMEDARRILTFDVLYSFSLKCITIRLTEAHFLHVDLKILPIH